MDRKIGAQLYTVREFCTSRESFKESVKKVSQIGYKHVQMSGVGPFGEEDVLDCPDFIKGVCDENGLEITCTHRPFESLINNLDREIEYHKALDCKIMGVGGLPEEARDSREHILETIEKLNKVNSEIAKHGMTFVYHNHAYEFVKFDGKRVIDYILENGKFNLLIDVYWVALAGIDPAKFIRENAGRIDCLHFKDIVCTTGNETAECEVGVGNLDWDDIIAACEETGVEFGHVEQDICLTDPFGCLKTSYEYLTKKGFY